MILLYDVRDWPLYFNSCQTFQLIDLDDSGTLDREELTSWMTMCGAELDVEKIIGALLGDDEDELTMCVVIIGLSTNSAPGAIYMYISFPGTTT